MRILWRSTLFIILFAVFYCGRGNPELDPQSLEVNRAARIQLLKEEGDRQFAMMYWAGWHRAALQYEEVLIGSDDQSLRQKLFDALILLYIREKSFSVDTGAYLERASELLPRLDSPVNRIHLKLAREIADRSDLLNQYGLPRQSEDYEGYLKELKILCTHIDIDYRHYLYILYLGLHARSREFKQYIKEKEAFTDLYPDSNLRFFLTAAGESGDIETVADRYPDFIELHIPLADRLYNQKKFLAAEAKYRSILEVNPRVPAAHTGLGSIHFWLEFYEEALPYYEEALKLNPYYPKALFGKAVSLHYLGRYDDSNRVLDVMLEKQSFYHGEAHYFKAVNHYHLHKLDRIEEHIRIAETYIPDSVELNTFAGIYYYHLKQLEKAASYFKRVLERRRENADAHYYLGLIDIRQTGGGRAPDLFEPAARYFLKDLHLLEGNLDRVEHLDISARHKEKRRLKIIARFKEMSQKYLQYGRNIKLIYKERRSPLLDRIHELLDQLQQVSRRF